MKIAKPTISVMILIVLAACGTSAAEYNNDGNDAFASEQLSEALDNYTSAKQEDPSLAEPYYNAGNALHRQGDFDAATMQLQEALRGGEQALAQNSFFNLGNTYFKQEDWLEAIDAYRQALLINPNDQDAKYNLELALQNLLEQQQQQQPQPQNQGDQPQDNQGGQQQQDQPQSGQGEQDQENQGGGEGEREQESGGGQGDEPDQQPRELSPDEAKQILDALGQDSQTLQERLQQQVGPPALPPQKDW